MATIASNSASNIASQNNDIIMELEKGIKKELENSVNAIYGEPLTDNAWNYSKAVVNTTVDPWNQGNYAGGSNPQQWPIGTGGTSVKTAEYKWDFPDELANALDKAKIEELEKQLNEMVRKKIEKIKIESLEGIIHYLEDLCDKISQYTSENEDEADVDTAIFYLNELKMELEKLREPQQA